MGGRRLVINRVGWVEERTQLLIASADSLTPRRTHTLQSWHGLGNFTSISACFLGGFYRRIKEVAQCSCQCVQRKGEVLSSGAVLYWTMF